MIKAVLLSYNGLSTKPSKKLAALAITANRSIFRYLNFINMNTTNDSINVVNTSPTLKMT